MTRDFRVEWDLHEFGRRATGAGSPRQHPRPGPAVLRTFNAVTGALTPALSARVARYLLLHPRASRPRDWELPALAAVRRVTFQFGLSGLRWGDGGPVVLMMHGWEGRPTQFRYFIEPLLAAGRQVVALDAPAHGESARAEATLMEFATSLSEVAAEIGEVESVVGHSMGAAAAAIALSHGLTVERAVLIASASSIEGTLQDFASSWGLTRRAAELFIKLVGHANGVPAGDLDIARIARGLDVPALIVHDRDDTAVPFADGETIARNWRGSQLLATSGLGHWKVLTDASVAQHVAGFLTGSAAVPPRHDLERAA